MKSWYGKGYPLYSPVHFIYLAVLFSLILLGVYLVSKFGKKKIREITLVVAVIITVFEVIKIASTFVLEYLNVEENNILRWLPLSFCSLFIYSSWLSISKNEKLHKIGSSFLVSGALFAGLAFLLYPSTAIPDWPWWHFYSMHAMIYHSLMLFTGIINLLFGDVKPELKNFIYYIIFTFSAYIVALVLCNILDINLMFLIEPYALPDIVKAVYNFSHILYTSMIILGYTLLYLIAFALYKLALHIINKKNK